jgi:transcriptional regulator with XRE-family HTH domain
MSATTFDLTTAQGWKDARLYLGKEDWQMARLLTYGDKWQLINVEKGRSNAGKAATRLMAAYLSGWRPAFWNHIETMPDLTFLRHTDGFYSARLHLGLTQPSMARLVGYSEQSRVSEIEHGRRVASKPVALLVFYMLNGYRPPDWPTEEQVLGLTQRERDDIVGRREYESKIAADLEADAGFLAAQAQLGEALLKESEGV